MISKAKTVEEYLRDLPSDRKNQIEMVRNTLLKNLPKGYEEIMQYGMISYVVPLNLYPKGYLDDGKTPLCYISLGNQKNHMSLYLTNIYMDEKLRGWFEGEYKKSGKKMDIGKSCVRFKTLENLPLPLIGKAVAETTPQAFIEMYENARKR